MGHISFEIGTNFFSDVLMSCKFVCSEVLLFEIRLSFDVLNDFDAGIINEVEFWIGEFAFKKGEHGEEDEDRIEFKDLVKFELL